ncbi:hypothetical protein POM88_006316 [Heracleum sosnowskyi]|uniref:Uncharacterized protein n=1 Tax=Heracleum sosnowskyi TaxID=360622 RepID=A0AAD8N6D2_9APIA|nr:hypothetical protein POM88_006316 [Heracleum sosnowskyi]
MKKSEPITTNYTDSKWSSFKNYWGALDGTHVKVRVRVRENDKVRNRNRKGEISTNVLAQVSGKDRAIGEGVESPVDAVEEISNNEEKCTYQQPGQQKDNLENEVSPRRNAQPIDASSLGSKGLKTNLLDIVKELTFGLQKISDVMKNRNENIARLTNCFQHELDGAKKRMLVNSELLKIEGLSPKEFIKAWRKTALDPLETYYFLVYPKTFDQHMCILL